MRRSLLPVLLLGGCLPWMPPAREPAAPSAARVDRLVHDEANVARRRAGARPLAWSDALADVAEGHSREMARTGRFDHADARGGGAFERLRRARIRCASVGENLYVTTRYETVRTSREGRTYDWYTPRELARNTIAGWMQSPGHRRNLLDRGFARQGIGVAERGERVFVTQVLCA